MLMIAAAVGALALSATPPTTSTQAPHIQRPHAFAGLSVSPDGRRLAAVEAEEAAEAASSEPHGQVVVRDAKGAVTGSFDPCPTCAYRDPTFSPDGRSVAFLGRDRRAGTTTLYVATGASAAARATFSGVGQRPRWSPDGASLAMLAVVGAHKELGATQAAAPQVGEIGEAVDEQRIGVVPAAGAGGLRLVSPADTFIYEYDWTPDGRGFVATAAKGDGDNNWWVADLEAVDLASGAARRIAKPKDQLNAPRVSPDGRRVAYIGGLMSDFGSVGGDLWIAPIAGGEAKNLTPDFHGSFTSLVWRKGVLLATALIGDKAAVVTVDPDTGRTRVLASAPVSLAAGDGRLAFDAAGDRAGAVVQDFEHAPEIAYGLVERLGLAGRITNENAFQTAPGTARSVTWTSDGAEVQGWLLAPLGVEAGKTYPMVVTIHGGPSAASTPTFPREGLTRKLLAKGYYVFEPNPRGSYGQGEAFTRANVRDFGGGDLRDILAGVDAVEKIAPVDEARLGVYGHCYGGFMTMWTVTHTARFHAAVAGAGVANWISYYGENGIDQWMIPFFGASAYDDPDIYRKLSPLETIKQAKTPTFIYVGERDVECPAPQSVEFWHALKEVGVPTKLLILEGEGHGIRKPDHIKQLSDGEIGWFDKYLGK